MPYIVEKDYVKGSYLTRNAEAGDSAKIIYLADTTHFTTAAARIYDDTLGYDTVTGYRLNSEVITITAIDDATATYGTPNLVLNNVLSNSYTGQFSGNLYQHDLAISERVEFDIRILSRWCKIAQIKIVQQTMGAMKISFEVWEEIPIYEGNRLEMHKNVIRRNIVLTDEQGGWYGESLVNNLILYKDRKEPLYDPDVSERVPYHGPYNLHCALVNEDGGTASDFHVLFKIADIGELV